jgi:hypothetical protein
LKRTFLHEILFFQIKFIFCSAHLVM